MNFFWLWFLSLEFYLHLWNQFKEFRIILLSPNTPVRSLVTGRMSLIWWTEIKHFPLSISQRSNIIIKQECIPVGCVPAAHWPYAGVCFPGGGVLLGGFSLPGDPPVNRITDTCKNITLATTSLRPVNMHVHCFILCRGEGYISFQEAIQILKAELRYPEERALHYVKKFDKNKDGRLSASEFQTFKAKIQQTWVKKWIWIRDSCSLVLWSHNNSNELGIINFTF